MALRVLIFFIVSTTTALGEITRSHDTQIFVAPPREDRIVIEQEPHLRFVTKVEGRAWSSVELNNVNDSFNLWMTCFTDPNSDTRCANCQSPHTDKNVVELEDFLATRCLPAQRDRVIAFSDRLTQAQKRQRDRAICNCFASSKANQIEQFSYSIGQRIVEETLDDRRKKDEERDNEIIERLVNERVQSAMSAASFLNDGPNGMKLAARYNVRPPLKTDISNEWAKHLNELAARADSLDISNALEDKDLPQNYCIPYRHFLASRQFPENPAFYKDLDNLSKFNASDWNYSKIMQNMRNAVGRRDFAEALRTDPVVEMYFVRAKFLYDNPVFKNIFMANGSNARELQTQLFNKIKSIPQPDCKSFPCTRDLTWSLNVNRYRGAMAQFLSSDAVIALSNDGGVAARQMNSASADALSQSEMSQSASALRGEAETNPGAWNGFCANQQRQRNNREELSNFISDREQAFGHRDFDHQSHDEDFRKMNEEVCNLERKSRDHKNSSSFLEFIAAKCGQSHEGNCSPTGRSLLLTEFFEKYPLPSGNNSSEALLSSIAPFMNGTVKVATVTKSDADNFVRITNDPVLSRSSVSFSSDFDSFSGSRADVAPIKPLTPSTTTAKNDSSAQNSANNMFNNNQFGNLNPFETAFLPQVTAPIAPAPQKQTQESARAALAQNETESRAIRDEISNLRNVVKREAESESRDPAGMSELNARLAALQKRLDDKNTQNADLQRKISSLNDDSSAKPTSVNSDSSIPERQSNSGTSSSAPAVAAVSGGVSGGSVSTPVMSSGGATLGGSAGGGGRAPASVSTQSSSTEGLEKFGVQSTTQQGAIIVANASSSIDFQELRLKSGNNIVPLTVTEEEFNKIAGNDKSVLSRYLDRMKAMPGEVVRVNVTAPGDSRSIEMFVVKNGDQISVVQGPGVGRAVASEMSKPVERDATLKGLRDRIQEGTN